MKIALVHDAVAERDSAEALPEDHGAEYDDERTVAVLLGAIRSLGHEAVEMLLDEHFPQALRRVHPDLVFNIAEGIRGTGRESIVPAWLDHLGIPYTGSDPLTFAVTLDKAMAKTIARAHGIPTPAWRCVFDESELDGLRLEFPLFVKPNGEGSSMGIRRSSLVGDEGELRQRVRWVLQQYRQGCLVEEYMPGREFCVGILGNRELEILPIVEVRTSAGFYSYESKSVHDKELICPAQVPGRLADDMREMGRTSFREFRCRDLARLDVKLDAHGAPGFLEMNPLPGLSPYYSIFNVQARAAGIEFEELIRRIIANALERSGPSSKGAGK